MTKKVSENKKTKESILKTLYRGKQQALLAELTASRRGINHMPTMGDVSEEKWKKLFREILPDRYEISKAHVIDSLGQLSDQIDLVIYDKQYASLAFIQDGLIYVPSEAVYAVCELKQNCNKANLKYASDKIHSVRRLTRTSKAIPQINGSMKKKSLKPIIGCMIVLESDYAPSFGTGFQKNIKSHTGLKKIDLIYSIKDGVNEDKSNPDIGLVIFIFKLLQKLQNFGNAPAIDFEKYIASI